MNLRTHTHMYIYIYVCICMHTQRANGCDQARISYATIELMNANQTMAPNLSKKNMKASMNTLG